MLPVQEVPPVRTVQLQVMTAAETLVPNAEYDRRMLACAATHVAWSPVLALDRARPGAGAGGAAGMAGGEGGAGEGVRHSLLAVGNKCGDVQLWRHTLPQDYRPHSRAGAAAAGAAEGGGAAAGAGGGGSWDYAGQLRSPARQRQIGAVRVLCSAWEVVPCGPAGAGGGVGEGVESVGRWGVVGSRAAQAGDLLLLTCGEWRRQGSGGSGLGCAEVWEQVGQSNLVGGSVKQTPPAHMR